MSTKDPLAADNDSTGLSGPLHTVTLSTNDLEEIKKFYVDGMGLTMDGPIKLGTAQSEAQRKLWQLDSKEEYDFYHLYRASVPELIQIRLLHFKEKKKPIHSSYNSMELGPFSLGFPNLDQKALDTKLRKMGIGSMDKMQEGTIPRPDGSTYRYWETIFNGPDYVHSVGIERGDGMPPLSPSDTLTKLGGPGYSAQVITDSDRYLEFMTDVLDLELRADRQWESSPGSALGIEEGIPFRFALVYAKGSSYNHFLFLDFFESEMIDPGVPPRIPHLGLGAWTIETKDIKEVTKRAKEFGSTIIAEDDNYDSPIFGRCEIVTMLAPNGFIIELFQKKLSN